MKGAGCLFIQSGFALVGYTPKLKKWSGIGGKVLGTETLRETAIREMLEELFGLEPFIKLIKDCDKILSNIELIINDFYGILPISFISYKKIAQILVQHKCKSPYYKTVPMSFVDLINERIPEDISEITELKVINYNLINPDIDPDFINDCMLIEKKLKL